MTFFSPLSRPKTAPCQYDYQHEPSLDWALQGEEAQLVEFLFVLIQIALLLLCSAAIEIRRNIKIRFLSKGLNKFNYCAQGQ
jgi:hypothetical protein